MDLHIKTKFDIGQDVHLVYRNKQEVNDLIPCTFCDGNGFFIYKGEKCKCPKCSGRRIRTEKKTAIKYSKKQMLVALSYVLSGKFLRLN